MKVAARSCKSLILLLNVLKLVSSSKREEKELCDAQMGASLKPIIDTSLNDLAQDDPKLVEAVKKRLVLAPTTEIPYNFTR